jgi:hypothetical protein
MTQYTTATPVFLCGRTPTPDLFFWANKNNCRIYSIAQYNATPAEFWNVYSRALFRIAMYTVATASSKFRW